MSNMLCVNVAWGSALLLAQQQRLRRSLEAVGLPYRFFIDSLPTGALAHTDAPYAFKVYAMRQALEETGYTRIMWLDAPMIVQKRSVTELFDEASVTGGCFVYNGWSVGQWTSDMALQQLGLSREEALAIPDIIGGCFVLDFAHEAANNLFNDLWAYAHDGVSFQGAWSNAFREVSQDSRCLGHRHDQSILSVLAMRYGCSRLKPVQDDGNFIFYYETGGIVPNPDAWITIRGGVN